MNKHIKDIARNITHDVVAYITAHHDEEYAYVVENYLELISAIEQHLHSIKDNELGINKFKIRKEWNYTVSTFECGYAYIAHYALRLFAEMCDKRWAPKSRLGQVNTLASHYIKSGRANDRSTAMKLASAKVKRTTVMFSNSIIKDMQLLVESIDVKCSEAVRAHYPCLMVNMEGKPFAAPKDYHVRLIAKLVETIASVTGYN